MVEFNDIYVPKAENKYHVTDDDIWNPYMDLIPPTNENNYR